jgi:adenine-specific DNA-methyltransferase
MQSVGATIMAKQRVTTPKPASTVTAITHQDAKRLNTPSIEQEPIVPPQLKEPRRVNYPRNPDLDPQLVWRGKEQQNERDLVVNAPTIYKQETVHPQALIEELLRAKQRPSEPAPDLFADLDKVPDEADVTAFYQHDRDWSNRMILGDSLQVMASLAEREGLRGKVQ